LPNTFHLNQLTTLTIYPIKNPFEELVITNKNPLGAYFYDTFGNRTSSLTISSKQLLQIEKILNQS
jgi:hypothetical protein